LIFTPHGELVDRIDAGSFYIGLGDRFDDERRLVRETASALRPAIRATHHPRDIGVALRSRAGRNATQPVGRVKNSTREGKP